MILEAAFLTNGRLMNARGSRIPTPFITKAQLLEPPRSAPRTAPETQRRTDISSMGVAGVFEPRDNRRNGRLLGFHAASFAHQATTSSSAQTSAAGERATEV